MAVIAPPAIATAAGATAAGVTTRALRITRSALGMPGRRYVPRRTRRQGRTRPYASAWILPQGPPHQHGNVVRSSSVEGVAQQVAVPEQVAAAVAHLEEIRARPDANPQCQRRRHVRLQRTRRTASLNVLVDPQCGRFERPGEALFVRRVLRVIAVYRLGDVPSDRADRQPTRLLASGRATDAIGDHGEERQALGVLRQELGRGEAREMHLNLFVERGDEEVILVLVPHFARVGEAKDVDLIVAWLATSRDSGRSRVGRLHAGHLTLRNQGGDDTSASMGIARAAQRSELLCGNPLTCRRNTRPLPESPIFTDSAVLPTCVAKATPQKAAWCPGFAPLFDLVDWHRSCEP